MIATYTLRQLIVVPVSMHEAKLAANWLADLPKDERDAIKAHLRSFKPSQCTTMGIGRYWKLTTKEKATCPQPSTS